MEKGNTYHVNIYYSEEEIHDAFKNYYNDVKQVSKVHIFTKDAMPLSLYGEENNVELYSSGGLWDKLKAWLAGEALFEQQLSQLNISKENQERYRSIIKNGGTIIVSTQDESINLPIKDVNEINDTAFIEDSLTPLPPTISNDLNLPQTNENVLRTDSQINDAEISTFNENDPNHEEDNTLFEIQSDDAAPSETENQPLTQVTVDLNAIEMNEINELDAQLNKGTHTDLDLQNKYNKEEENNTPDNADEHDKTSEELTGHSNEPSLNNSVQPTVDEQNLYIADVSTSDQVQFTNHQQYEYYEDGPRKHNLYSENLNELSSEQKEQTTSDNNEETFVVPTKYESVSHVPDEASNQTVDIMNLLNDNGTNQEDIANSIQQLQDLAQQAQQFYGFDNKQSQINELLDLVLQLSNDEAINIFNKISNSNIPTDSTESVLDFDLLAKLGRDEMNEIRKLFPSKQELENEMEINEQQNLSVAGPLQSAEPFEAEQLLKEISPETTSEHNRHDSP